MIRSIEFPCDPRWIANPKNSSPVASNAARMGAAARTKLCIETVKLILSEHFTRPGRHYVASDGFTLANVWTCKLTRISTGTVDPITGGATMAAVQDGLARWCEVPNERDPVWAWIEPIGQESKGFVKGAGGKRRAWTGVRIELEDLAPGEPRRVVLKTIEPFIARAKADIKAREKAKMYTGTKTARVSQSGKWTKPRKAPSLVYHAAEGQQAASSAARSKAEAAFAKATGKAPTPLVHPTYGPVNVEAGELVLRAKGTRPRTPKAAPAGSEDATPRMLVDCPTCGAKRGIVCTTIGALVSGVHVERARLAGLASAAARVLPPSKPTGPRKVATTLTDEQAAMRAQARSKPCLVKGCLACIEAIIMPGSDRACSEVEGEPFEYGVHVTRARAAGLPPFPCAADLDAGARPVRVACGCGRSVIRSGPVDAVPTCSGCGVSERWTWLPGGGAEVWLCLPWGASCGCAGGAIFQGLAPFTCSTCNGAGRKPLYTRARDLEADPPERATFAVPVEHRAAFGPRVVLTREVFTTRANRLAWMFRTEKRG